MFNNIHFYFIENVCVDIKTRWIHHQTNDMSWGERNEKDYIDTTQTTQCVGNLILLIYEIHIIIR